MNKKPKESKYFICKTNKMAAVLSCFSVCDLISNLLVGEIKIQNVKTDFQIKRNVVNKNKTFCKRKVIALVSLNSR